MPVAEFSFAPDHPASRGHFPGNPIIPGAVLLDAALQVIEARLGVSASPCRIKSAKFLHPVRPGNTVLFEYLPSGNGDIRFSGVVAGETVLTGHLQCDPAPATA